MHLEIILPRIPRIFTDFDYFEINIRVIIEICVLLRTQYPCSSAISVGDSLCSLRFILPRIPQIFTDFIYSNIRVHLCYLWNTPSHPISVFICAICGRFLRTLTYVGDSLCCLRFDSPTDSTDIHRFYIFQYPCSYVLSVGNTFAPNIRVHLRYLWEPPSAS